MTTKAISVTVSLPIEDAQALDAAAHKAQMSRSKFVRHALAEVLRGLPPQDSKDSLKP